MQLSLTQARLRLIVALLLLCIALVAVLIVRAAAKDGQSPLTVMTRNLYLGADINRPLRAAQSRTGHDALLALGHANHQLREIVQRTNFGVRSELLADEIASTRPDLVGLQEVALWRYGPLQLDHLGRLDAVATDADFLAILRRSLTERGVSYDVVSMQQESDVEGPAFTGNPFRGTVDDGRDVRLTVRDVIMVRHGSPARVTDSGGSQYGHRIDVTLAGIDFAFIRGYAWADVAVGRARLKFVTTHLESLSADLALAQAGELLAALASSPMAAVIACDCNSDPNTGVVQPQDKASASAAYRLLTERGGFSDLWSHQQTSAGPGVTAGLSELVNQPTADGFTRRLDLVLARPTAETGVTSAGGDVVGDELTDRDDRTGLWPSDHAGVVMHLRIA
jgi:endonuclease/exonuclease/phosphatase family metal-dependent hydrolase